MHRPRVYVDNSVLSAIRDEEFSEPTARFFDGVRAGRYVVLVSEVTYRELALAPEEVRLNWESLPPETIEEVAIDEEVKALAEQYVRQRVLGRASVNDCLHVAAATVAGADLILSWNFGDIVNYNRIKGFNGVNVLNGYRSMTSLQAASPTAAAHDKAHRCNARS